MSEEANMFRDCGESGHYVNGFGQTQNLILVDCKNGIIYSKESIPLGNKVYLTDGTYLGLVSKCIMVNKSVGNIHEITLDDIPSKKVLCSTCDQPVKVDDLGSISKNGLTHDNLACLSPVEIQ